MSCRRMPSSKKLLGNILSRSKPMSQGLSLILLICFMTFGTTAQHKSDNWFPVYLDGKAGYINREGKIVLEPKYDGASFFSEGLARVSVGRDTIITEGFSQG